MYGFIAKRLRAPFRREEKSHGGRVSLARVVGLCLEVLETRIVLSGFDWSMYNYDAGGTRDNIAEHTLSPSDVSSLQVLWNFPTKGVVAGTPAVVGDTIYAGDSMGNFYAVTSDGKLLWQTQMNGPVTDSALVVGNTVIFGTLGNSGQGIPGTIYGLDAGTGKVLWETRPQGDPLAQIWGSATLVDGNVAIGVASGDEGSPLAPGSRGSLVLLDPDNGHIIWQTYTISNTEYANGARGAAIWSTPAYDPALHLIYAGTGNNYAGVRSSPTTATSDAMIAFDASDGHIVWVNQRTTGDDWNPHFSPLPPDYDFGDSPHIYTLANGETVVGSGQKSGFYHVFDAATGTIINQIQAVPGGSLGGLFATAAVDPATDVVFANGRHPYPDSSQPATGDLVAIAGDASGVAWDFPTPSPDLSGVALANGVVYFQDIGGTFYALDEKTGAVLAQLFTGGSNSGPAIANGQILLGQGNILAHGFNSPGGIVALGVILSDKNFWGVFERAPRPFWVSDQRTNVSTIYSVTSAGVRPSATTPSSMTPSSTMLPPSAALTKRIDRVFQGFDDQWPACGCAEAACADDVP